MQKKLHKLVTNGVFWGKKTHQQNKNIKHKNPCQSRELNMGPLAQEAYALSLHHSELRVASVVMTSYLTLSTQSVET